MRQWTPSRATLFVAWLALGVAAVAAGAFLAVWTPPEDAHRSICLFRRVLNLDCPSCGMTRGLSLLAHGEWRLAWLKHPLAPIVIVEAAMIWGVAGFGLVTRRLARPGWGRVNVWLLVNAVAFYGVWIIRMVGRATGK